MGENNERAKAYVIDNWDALIKWAKVGMGILAATFALGGAAMTLATKHDVEAATRDKPSEERVIELIQGPTNQYTTDQDVIMSVVKSYRDDMRRMDERLVDLQVDVARVILLLENKLQNRSAQKNKP